MLKTIRKLLKTKAQREEAVADFLSTLGAAITLGTIGALVLAYVRIEEARRSDGFASALEDQRDKIEEALIGAGILTRDDVDAHGILSALRKAADKKSAPPRLRLQHFFLQVQDDHDRLRSTKESVMSNKKPAKTAPPVLAPAMSPFDVELTPEAQRHLAATISQITLDFLAKGLRQVGVPVGQATAVKAAFESAVPIRPEPDERGLSTVLSSNPPKFKGRRWHVEIAKVNGLLAELHFSAEGDPVAAVPASVLLPRVDELLAWSRTPEAEVFGDESPLGKILGNLRTLRAMVGG